MQLIYMPRAALLKLCDHISPKHARGTADCIVGPLLAVVPVDEEGLDWDPPPRASSPQRTRSPGWADSSEQEAAFVARVLPASALHCLSR